ncbi:MAG TPA: malto-oligosyltrehalose trehalohydrolase [Solibacterales bacterium]|nr:malto-oligosyltrehalose trehalohydrolase [Bryobacterales bacterium]
MRSVAEGVKRNRIGAWHVRGGVHFRVWAPGFRTVEVVLPAHGRAVRLSPGRDGLHDAFAQAVEPGQRYWFQLDGGSPLADPASRWQPEGVHGPSAVLLEEFPWTDAAWRGLSLRDYVIYELHVGTFTREGTFDAVIPYLGALRELGVTAIELMPVAEFPGARNWGYDGVFPFAAQSTYGGPAGLKRLVDAAHRAGLALVLDVVYNHLGPEGNVLPKFAPYFHASRHTPWGPAFDFEAAPVREYFLENVRQWAEEFHIDALRLDAVHAVPHAMLREIASLASRPLLFAEGDRNDPDLVRPPAAGGCGLDAQWSDDFHHALHTLLTGERHGYYVDYGSLEQLAKTIREGFCFTGEYSKRRQGPLGAPARDIPPERFIVFSQNHDQAGNRARGDRLSTLVEFEALKLAAALTILSPFTPLLFMGEEYGETNPFPYFVSHTDPRLVEAVRKGRRREFPSLGGMPDPQAPATFASAVLTHVPTPRQQVLREFYRELLRVRRALPANAGDVRIEPGRSVLRVHRRDAGKEFLLFFSFSGEGQTLPDVTGQWRILLQSAAPRWGGSSPPDHPSGAWVLAPLSCLVAASG